MDATSTGKPLSGTEIAASEPQSGGRAGPERRRMEMGLFDRHDYGRDYGGGRSLGDRVRGAWNRFESRLGGGGPGRGYDRGMAGGGRWRGGGQGYGRYDQDMARRGSRYGGDYGARGGYDRELRGGYDREMARGRDCMRTDAGDPF